MLYLTEYSSPLGEITLAGNASHIIGLWFHGQKYFQKTLPEEPVCHTQNAILNRAIQWLDRYFAGQKPLPQELPLAPVGSPFRQIVWNCLCEIPYGKTTTYSAIARQAASLLGRKSMSAQAVGGAVGHNPISIIIPCHRVIGANGSLVGYAGGIDKKRQLLKIEGADI